MGAEEFSWGKMLFRAGIRAAASCVPGGLFFETAVEQVAEQFCVGAWEWLRGKPAAEQQGALNGLAVLPAAEARALAEEALSGTEMTDAVRAKVVSYLTVVPMTVSRSLSRPNDGGRPSTLLSQLPRRPEDLRRLLPGRPPRFEPGTRVPGREDWDLDVLLGQGGFGEVWLGRHFRQRAAEPRAFKFCLDQEMVVSLERELDLLDRIKAAGHHPGIVRLLDTAVRSRPPYLIYEYVDGGDLVGWLAGLDGRPAKEDQVLPVLAWPWDHPTLNTTT